MFGFALLLLLALVLLWALVVAWTAWLLTHPPRRTYTSAVARGLPGDPSELVPSRPFTTWTFRVARRSAAGLEIPVWDISGDNPAGPVIVLTHGWGDSRIGALVRIPHLVPLASRLIAWDMPGHGEAPGTCSVGPDETEALRTLLRTLHEQGVTRPVLLGWSLGAVCSIEVASTNEFPLRALIAECPYRLRPTPARNVLRARGLPHRLTLAPAFALAGLATAGRRGAHRPFDCAATAALAAPHCPLLVLHGDADAVSPFDDGRAIAGSAGTFIAIPGAGHNDVWTNPEYAAQAAAAILILLT